MRSLILTIAVVLIGVDGNSTSGIANVDTQIRYFMTAMNMTAEQFKTEIQKFENQCRPEMNAKIKNGVLEMAEVFNNVYRQISMDGRQKCSKSKEAVNGWEPFIRRNQVLVGMLIVLLLGILCMSGVILSARMEEREERERGRDHVAIAPWTDCGLGACLVNVADKPAESLQRPQLNIEFQDIGLILNDGKWVLEGVTGDVKAGELFAIMGPSGAGKTTCMNVLCGKANSYGKPQGITKINGVAESITQYKEFMGFVPQDDTVHETLTPLEQVQFSASLRRPKGTSRKQCKDIAKDVLKILQIDEGTQNTVVGNVESRGISGGQRKRVNIGLELAALPSVLFLDEPTSGLDSTGSQKIIESLRDMAALGMTSIMVIHQPRFSLFRCFDKVLLLEPVTELRVRSRSNATDGAIKMKIGKTAYFGPSEQATDYFQTTLGVEMPAAENPADWLMDVIADMDSRPRAVSEHWAESGRALSKSGDVTASVASSRDASLIFHQKGFFEQLIILFKRQRVQWDRGNEQRMLFLGVAALAAVILAAMDKWVQPLPTWSAEPYLNLHTTLALLDAVFCLKLFGIDRPLFWREASSGLNISAFYWARVLANLLDVVLMAFIVSSLYYLMIKPTVNFSWYFVPMLLVTFASSGVGFLISTLLPPQPGPFVAAIFAFVSCGLLGNPMKVADFQQTWYLELIMDCLSITRWSVGMAFGKTIELAPPEPSSLRNVKTLELFMNTYIGCELHTTFSACELDHLTPGIPRFQSLGYWWTGALFLVCQGSVLRICAYLCLEWQAYRLK